MIKPIDKEKIINFITKHMKDPHLLGIDMMPLPDTFENSTVEGIKNFSVKDKVSVKIGEKNKGFYINMALSFKEMQQLLHSNNSTRNTNNKTSKNSCAVKQEKKEERKEVVESVPKVAEQGVVELSEEEKRISTYVIEEGGSKRKKTKKELYAPYMDEAHKKAREKGALPGDVVAIDKEAKKLRKNDLRRWKRKQSKKENV